MEPTRVNIHQWYYIICIYIYWQLYIFFKTKINLFKSIWREKQVKVSRIRCIIIVEILNPLPSSYRLCKFCNAKMVSNGERNVVGIDPGPSRHRKVEHGDALWSCLHFSFFFFLTLFSPLLGTLLAEHTPAPSSRRFSRGSYQARDPAKAPLILFSNRVRFSRRFCDTSLLF